MATFFFKTSTWYCLIFILGFNRSFHLFICINEAEILIWFICISHGLFLVYEISVKWMTTSCPTIALASGNLVLVLPSFTEFFFVAVAVWGVGFYVAFRPTNRNGTERCQLMQTTLMQMRCPAAIFFSLSLSLFLARVCSGAERKNYHFLGTIIVAEERERERKRHQLNCFSARFFFHFWWSFPSSPSWTPSWLDVEFDLVLFVGFLCGRREIEITKLDDCFRFV